MKKPFISVIVPIYNIEPEYLLRCINSILTQTYTNYELILVDDGATDGSGAIIDGLKLSDSRITVIHKTNGGSSSARNAAIKISKGDYLSFIDSDDYIEPWFLERLIKPIEEDSVDVPKIVQIGRDEIGVDGNKLPEICMPPNRDMFIDSKTFFESLIRHEGDCSFCTKLVARELFDNREFPVGKLNEDFRLLVDLLLDCDGVYSLHGYGYHVFYRIGSNSRKRDSGDFSRVYSDNIDNADYIEQLVKKHYPDLSELAVRFALFQRMDYMLHIPINCMRKDYKGYPECEEYIRKHWPKLLTNSYLTGKNKVYLTLFAVAPKTVRKVHAELKHL